MSNSNYVFKILDKNGWKKCKNFTKEDVRRIREELESKTEDAFKEFDRAKQRAWEKAALIILD